MPIVHKMILQPNEDIVLATKLSWAESLMKLRLEKFEKSIFSLDNKENYCICVHPESSHQSLISDKCSYNEEFCICDGFKLLTTKFKLIVEITTADVFEFEVKDHSERDSFSWWNEFQSWRKLNANS